MGKYMYLDLLTNASLLDHTVWASPDTWAAGDTWTQALDYAGKKKKKSNGGLIFGGLCCLLVVALIIGGIYLLKSRKNQN
ncbi:hypothetical protein [Nocardia sp. NPDC051463]|uniref:hypothetical protein n=1 Tax=Nocardia sp. NPDC051463 TaxID=3154845 RepID=UPI003431C962